MKDPVDPADPVDSVSVLMAGFGGQGMLLAGKVLAQASMDVGREVSWLPSYGPAGIVIVGGFRPIIAPVLPAG